MSIKSENEIKVEELDLEYDSYQQGSEIDIKMSIKSEFDVEELDLQYDTYQQGSQIFSDNEAHFALPEGIKNEELDEKASIESELREWRESVLDIELVNTVIKYENVMMIEKKSCAQHLKIFTTLKNVSSLLKKINEKCLDEDFESDEERFFAQLVKSKSPSVLLNKLSDKELKILLSNVEVEKGSKMKSTSKSRSPTSVTHDESIKKSHLENLSCRFCNFSFKGQIELKSHLQTHDKIKFKCDHCNYESNFKSLLRRHLLIHNNIKLYKCSECSYESNRKEHLKVHLLNHENIKLFKCSNCSFECSRKDILKRHMLIHLNVKLFKCCECNYGCNEKRYLKIHMLSHQNIKLFKCSVCNYEGNDKGRLKKHMLTHGNVKLFKCSKCSFECSRKDILKRHMLIHLNIKLFKCSECSYECNRKDVLKRHMLTHENV
ncbi:UNVERIFIED_CONTAM: hypothetical protein RMT77_014806 [Armadillidium vulgare]